MYYIKLNSNFRINVKRQPVHTTHTYSNVDFNPCCLIMQQQHLDKQLYSVHSYT